MITLWKTPEEYCYRGVWKDFKTREGYLAFKLKKVKFRILKEKADQSQTVKPRNNLEIRPKGVKNLNKA